AASEQCGAGRERWAEVVRSARVEHRKASTVVVAEERRRTVGTRDVHQVVQQRDERGFYCLRERDAVVARENQKVQVEICRVAVVVARLFEINAIGFDVNRDLPDQDLAAEVLPALRFFKLGEQRAEVKKSERFTGQVRVWTEVSR